MAKAKGDQLVIKVTTLGGGRYEIFADGLFQGGSAFMLLVAAMEMCIHTLGRSFDEIVQELSVVLDQSGPVLGPPDIFSTH